LKLYKCGQPRYISDPDNSVLWIIPHDQFKKLPVREVQNLLAGCHIVVTGVPTETLAFDEDGLESLQGLDATTEIQGWYPPLALSFDFTHSPFSDQSIDRTGERVQVGTLEQVLEATRRPHGPIASAVSLPLPLSAIEKSTVSSEIEAWLLTEGRDNQQYPTALMRWGQCSSAGAHHWTCIDSDGLGTFVSVLCGAQWWFLLEQPHEHGKSHFGSVQDFLVGFEASKATHKFNVEAVYLTPGTRLSVSIYWSSNTKLTSIQLHEAQHPSRRFYRTP
jgi:hypothetical protein